MALSDLLELNSPTKRQKVGLSEERVRAVVPALR